MSWQRPPDVPWTVGDVFRAILLEIAIVGAALAAVLVSLQLIGVSRLRDLSLPVPYVVPLALLILEATLLIPTWLFAVRKRRTSWRRLGLRAVDPGRGCALVGVYFLLSLVVLGLWGAIAARLHIQGQPNIFPVFGRSLAGVLLAWLTLGLVAPFVEELFFRGFVYAGLRQRLGAPKAVLLSAAVFSVMHGTPGVLVPFVFLGTFLAVVYEQTGSLVPGMILHSLINSLAVAGFYLSSAGAAR